MIKNLKIINTLPLNNKIRIVNNFVQFRDVFKVFMDEPFYEAWTNDDMEEEYNEIKNNGEIIGYYNNNDLSGILTLIDGARESHPVKFFKEHMFYNLNK